MTADLLEHALTLRADTIEGTLMYRDYHRGIHRLDFASTRFRESWGWVLRTAIENLCPAVVSAYVDRLSIASWGSDTNNELARELGLDRLQNLVHTEAHVTGNAFAITWRDPHTGQARPTFHRADQVVPLVNEDAPDHLERLVKLWRDDEGYGRATIYDAKGITRWRSKSKATQGKRDSGLTSPIGFPRRANEWAAYDTDGAPHEEAHGFDVVPAVWWKRAAPSQFEPGVSILRDMISPQDRLNKVNADMVIAAERIALPIRYILNVIEEAAPTFDPKTGRFRSESPLDETVNSLLTLSAGGPAGQFPGPDANQLVAMKSDLEGEIARIVGVPYYYLAQSSGDVPSGESLRVVTSRLAAGVTTFLQDATAPWKGQAELLGMTEPQIEWDDVMPTDGSELLARAEVKQRLGYAFEDIVAGLDEADAEGILQRAAEARQESATDIGRALASGQIPAAY